MRNLLFISLLLWASLVVGPAFAQQPAAPPPAYGEQIDIENAKKAAAAAGDQAGAPFAAHQGEEFPTARASIGAP